MCRKFLSCSTFRFNSGPTLLGFHSYVTENIRRELLNLNISGFWEYKNLLGNDILSEKTHSNIYVKFNLSVTLSGP